jgi:chromosome segregation ATPase
MTAAGRKILDALQEALAGDIARVTVAGQTWIHVEELEQLRAQVASLKGEIDWHCQDRDRLLAEASELKDDNRRLKSENDIQADKLERMQARLNTMRADGAKFLAAYDVLQTTAGKLSIALREALQYVATDTEPGRRAAEYGRAILNEAAGE